MRDGHSFQSANPESLKRPPAWPYLILYAMAAVFLAIAVLLVFVGQQAVADARLLAAEGVPVVATVGEKVMTETRTRDANDRWRTNRSYRVDLSYTTASGEVIELEKIVGETRFGSLEEGQVLQVFYVPSRPTLMDFEKPAGDGGGWIFWLTAAVPGLVGVGLGLGGRAIRRRMVAALNA